MFSWDTFRIVAFPFPWLRLKQETVYHTTEFVRGTVFKLADQWKAEAAGTLWKSARPLARIKRFFGVMAPGIVCVQTW